MITINTETMSAITAERDRITQRLARAQANVTTFSMELQELDAAERLLSRFSKTGSPTTRTRTPRTKADTAAPKRGRGRPPLIVNEPDAPTAKRTREPAETSLSNLALEAARASPGQTGAQITAWINETYKMSARPNHVGAVLERHGRAGRLAFSGEKKNRTWYEPTAMPKEKAA